MSKRHGPDVDWMHMDLDVEVLYYSGDSRKHGTPLGPEPLTSNVYHHDAAPQVQLKEVPGQLVRHNCKRRPVKREKRHVKHERRLA